MNEAHRENLSAFTDGELAFDQVRFMLRRIENDAELRVSWSSYHVGRDCLRREFTGLASADFADRVMAALDTPAAVGSTTGRWLRWSAGGAIAASVAAVALMVARPTTLGPNVTGQPQTAAAIQSTGSNSVADTPARAAPEVPRWLASPSPAARLTQPASASVLDGQVRGDTLIPAAYSRHMAPYMGLQGYPTRPAANARQYGRSADGRWVIPMMPPATERTPAHPAGR
jgi:sigma-E factor negative regulatory protein RseA